MWAFIEFHTIICAKFSRQNFTFSCPLTGRGASVCDMWTCVGGGQAAGVTDGKRESEGVATEIRDGPPGSRAAEPGSPSKGD